ncbi:MAG: hypothetical protein RSD88_06960 [Anaerovoracaceae bacterium]
MKLYMAVTADKYEFPMMVVDKPKYLAAAFGITNAHILNYITLGSVRRNDGVKFLRIEVCDE